jgi:hypothetical protein
MTSQASKASMALANQGKLASDASKQLCVAMVSLVAADRDSDVRRQLKSFNSTRMRFKF